MRVRALDDGERSRLHPSGRVDHNGDQHLAFEPRAAELLGGLPPEEAIQKWYDRVNEFKTMRIVD